MPDYDGLEIFNAESLAFIDSYTRDAESAWSFLDPVFIRSATNGRFILTIE